MWEVRKSAIHNRGMYATRRIRKGTRIIEYTGERISKEEADRRGLTLFEETTNTGKGSVYIFEINNDFDIDGNIPQNHARHINHSCDPNCESVLEGDSVWILAVRTIKKAEELSYDYGYELEHFEDHPCNCGSDNCVGYIVALQYREKLRKLLRKEKRKKTRKGSRRRKRKDGA